MDPPPTLSVNNGVALITLRGTEGNLPWGTPVREHRMNPPTVRAINGFLDTIEADPEVGSVVLTAEGKFWSNGMDLAWMDSHSAEEGRTFGRELTDFMARVLCFPLPTVAALNGHWCAAGGQLGLCFDVRVMNADHGFFFVPAVDLGVVYSRFQTALMMAKLPQHMQREVIIFNSTRWRAAELLSERVVDKVVPAADVVAEAVSIAAVLSAKRHGPARVAMGPIKQRVYGSVLDAMAADERDNSNLYAARAKGANYAPPPPSKL